MNVYEYKGYIGSAEVDTASGMLVGKLLFIRDSIGYSAESGKLLEAAFREAVDDYIAECVEHGDEPDVPCKGSFNVRIDADLHRRAAIAARKRQMTLNQLVGQALLAYCDSKTEHHTHVTVNVEQGQAVGIASAGVAPKWETLHGKRTH